MSEDELSKKRGKPKKAVPEEVVPKRAKRRDYIPAHELMNAIYHLSAQQLKFAKAVAMGAQDIDACRAAGYRVDGTRGPMRAHRLKKNPLVRAAIHQLKVEAFGAAAIEVSQVYRELGVVGFMPLEMCEGRVRVADKNVALVALAKIASSISKGEQAPREISIVSLITQSAVAPSPVKIETIENVPVTE